MSQTGEKPMKITKEIKLENPKRCDVCPELTRFLLECKLGHKVDWNKRLNIPQYKYVLRPQSCIKENGE